MAFVFMRMMLRCADNTSVFRPPVSVMSLFLLGADSQPKETNKKRLHSPRTASWLIFHKKISQEEGEALELTIYLFLNQFSLMM